LAAGYARLTEFAVLWKWTTISKTTWPMESAPEHPRTLTPRKTFLAGIIYFDQRKRTVQCVVRELSSDAATLVCQDARSVPANTIELYIPNHNKYYAAEVKERGANDLRVALSEDQTSVTTDDEPSDLARRFYLLESEVKHLRKIVEELKSKLPGTAAFPV
jgi:hypothetical protein